MAKLKDVITNHMASGRIDEALTALSQYYSSKGGDEETQVIMLQGQYAQYKRDERFGMGAKPETLNRIRFAIIEMSKEIEDDAHIEDSVKTPDNPTNNNPQPPVNQGTIKILFAAANPENTSRIRIGEESREIEDGIKMGKHRNRFEFIQRHATRTSDLRRALLDHEPTIVHFSGHGLKEGIILESNEGHGVFVNPGVLNSLFELFKDSVKCVILNSCYSEVQAKAIAEHIPYVVGMQNAMPDKAAIEFSVGFYDALAAGRDYEFAFRMGVTNIELAGIGGNHIPKMIGFDFGEEGFTF
ncbi:MAG: CHAT domain-containing protein [Bacteroidota bacterium]